MKTNMKPIITALFWVLALSLCGSISAWAQECTNDELCFNVTMNGEIVYVVRVYAPDITDPYNPDIGVDWPVVDGDRYVFTYAAYYAPEEGAKKPPAWSYIVFSLQNLPTGAVPPGAQTSLDKLPTACTASELDPNRIVYKLNPSVNTGATFDDPVLFELHSDSPGIDNCGKAAVILKDQCSGGNILMPGAGNAVLELDRDFICEDSDVMMSVQFDECTLEPIRFTCEDLSTGDITDAEYKDAVYARVTKADGSVVSDLLENAGPSTPGCIVCTDKKPIFIRGSEGWFCP